MNNYNLIRYIIIINHCWRPTPHHMGSVDYYCIRHRDQSLWLELIIVIINLKPHHICLTGLILLWITLVWLNYYFCRPRSPLHWLDPGAFGTLGVGGGFALGAKLCRPDCDVWIIYGDGSLGYSIAEFDTFTRHKVKQGFLIFCEQVQYVEQSATFLSQLRSPLILDVVLFAQPWVFFYMSFSFLCNVIVRFVSPATKVREKKTKE